MPRRKTPQSGAPSISGGGAAAFAAESGFRQSDGGPASAPDDEQAALNEASRLAREWIDTQ
jgi:hypothetical protein